MRNAVFAAISLVVALVAALLALLYESEPTVTTVVRTVAPTSTPRRDLLHHDRASLADTAGHPEAESESDAATGHAHPSQPRGPHAHPGGRRASGRAAPRSQARDPLRHPRRDG